MKKYLSILKTAYKNNHIYFYDTIGMNLIFILRIVVIITLYRALFAYGGNIQNTIGYSLEELSWALIITQALVTSKPRTTYEISTEVKSGQIVTSLLNPINYVWFKFFQDFSRFLSNIVPALIIGTTVGILVLGIPHTSVFGVLGGVLLIFGGMLVTFFSYMAIGLCAFFMEDTEALRWIYSKLDMLFGGNILPIPFLPLILQHVAFFSPFAAAGYTAGLIFIHFSPEKFFLYSGIQIFWIVFYIFLCLGIYSYASKRLVVNGG